MFHDFIDLLDLQNKNSFYSTQSNINTNENLNFIEKSNFENSVFNNRNCI